MLHDNFLIEYDKRDFKMIGLKSESSRVQVYADFGCCLAIV